MEKFKIFKKCGITASEAWRNLKIKKRDGSMTTIKIQDLPDDRFEELMDFKMEYFVKHEISHRVSGIPNNVDAMTEYRQFWTSLMKNNPSYVIDVFSLEGNNAIKPQIVGMSIVKLLKRDGFYFDTSQLKTKEVKNYFDILRRWTDLCPVSEIMRAHGIDTYYEDIGIAVHPEYNRCGLAYWCSQLRVHHCKVNGVPMTGAWMTSPYSEKVATKTGWQTVFKISYEDLSKKLGITFDNPPPMCRYMITKP